MPLRRQRPFPISRKGPLTRLFGTQLPRCESQLRAGLAREWCASEFAGVDEVSRWVARHEMIGRRSCSAVLRPLLKDLECFSEAGEHGAEEVRVLAVQPLEVASALDL